MRILGLFMLLVLGSAAAATSDVADPGLRGWHFFEVPPDPAPEVKATTADESQAAAPDTTPQVAASEVGSAAWLRAKLPVLLDRAIDSGDPEDVRAYLLAQRRVADLASRFREVATIVGLDPTLAESPTASFVRDVAMREGDARRQQWFAQQRGRVALMAFVTSRCGYCLRMAPLLDRFRAEGWLELVVVSLDGGPLPGYTGPWRPDAGQGRALNVRGTPWFGLLTADGRVQPVATGAVSYDQLLDRIERAAQAAGLMPLSTPEPLQLPEIR